MHRRIFHIIAAIFQQLWWPIMLVVGIGSLQTFLGNYARVLFQQLIDRFPSARQFSDLTPILAGYVIVSLVNHALVSNLT